MSASAMFVLPAYCGKDGGAGEADGALCGRRGIAMASAIPVATVAGSRMLDKARAAALRNDDSQRSSAGESQ